MRYLVAGLLVVAALAGCDDPVEPKEEEQGPYEVTTLQEGVDSAIFGDLNENGQALWHEVKQAVLWDNGDVLEIPVGKFLGSSGEVLGNTSVWIDGQLTELPGSTRGILEDGTIYLSRNDTMFTWRDGTLTATDRPPIGLVGPEGRIWAFRSVYDESLDAFVMECGFYLDGTWHSTGRDRPACRIVMAEEGGWAIKIQGLQYIVGPSSYYIADPGPGIAFDLAHVNSEGHAVATVGILGKPDGTRLDLRDHFEGTIRLGAINDDGEILAQLDNEIVLLTPR